MIYMYICIYIYIPFYIHDIPVVPAFFFRFSLAIGTTSAVAQIVGHWDLPKSRPAAG